MRKKICKRCKAIIEGTVCQVNDPDCPVVKHNQFATSFKGRLYIVDAQKSEIAKKINVAHNGEYAIKVS